MSSVAVLEAAIRAKSMYDKIVIENQNKEKIWKSEIFLQTSPSARWFRNGIHSLLRRNDARENADIIYRM